MLVLLVVFPPFLGILALPLALIGVAMTLWGALKCLAAAFGEDVTCGLLWLFLPLYNVYYMATRWDRVGRYFLTFVSGLVLIVAPLWGFKMMTEAQQAARNVDPNAEIAEEYDDSQLDQQVAEFHRNDFGVDSGTVPPHQGGNPAMAAGSTATGALGRSVPRLPGRPPPGAEVLDGRPEPLPSPPKSKIVIHTQSPVESGSPVWIDDKGWWYSGQVAALTDNEFRVMVTFDGWDDRPAIEINTARLRHRVPMSDELLTYKLKLLSYSESADELARQIDAKLTQAYGYVQGSVQVDLESYVITYQTNRGTELDDIGACKLTLLGIGVDTHGLGQLKPLEPSGQLMVGQVTFKIYAGEMPIEQAADLALRGYRQYVPGSAQVDQEAGVIRFVFDPGMVEDSTFEQASLEQLMAALGYFPFDNLSQPEATPYRGPAIP